MKWALCLILLVPAVAEAGWLVTVSPRWQVFAFAPEDEEPTPNYYAYAGGFGAGYSFSQTLDFALWGNYAPGALQKAEFAKENAQHYAYGVEFAGRFARSVYLALRGGQYSYNLIDRKREEEVDGRWQGFGGGVSLGAIFSQKRSAQKFWQVSLDFARAQVVQDQEQLAEDEEQKKRMFDTFSVSLTYVLNTKGAGGGAIFGKFMNSLGF